MTQTYKERVQELCVVVCDAEDAWYNSGIIAAAELAAEADASLASKDAEIAQMYSAAGEAQAERDAARDERDALAAEVAALREDAERYQFIRWYQDQDTPPGELRDILLRAHRRAHERGARRPSAEEYETALDESIAARKKG